MSGSIIWYARDLNRAGPARYFEGHADALVYVSQKQARGGGRWRVQWCHRDSVPDGEAIQ